MSYESMKRRIEYYGGAAQQDRMIKDKLKSMLSATKYSYQAARFLKYPEMHKSFVGLFNPVTQNMNYDTKMISTSFENDFKVGDVFLWDNTKTFWICYSQDRTELAYFKGSCRRCDYKVKWVDGDRHLRETFISVVGPNQPDYRTYNPGAGLSIDTATANLVVLVSDNEQNKNYFKQYQTFLIKGVTYKVHQIDNLSMPGVIELFCTQCESNLIDDDVEKDISNKWNVQPVIEQYPTQKGIDGPVSVKPLFPYHFTAAVPGGSWFILENKDAAPKNQLPIEFSNNCDCADEVDITWTIAHSGAYTLCYEAPSGIVFKRHIIVESLM